MADSFSNDIQEAKRRVEEMKRRSQSYIEPKLTNKTNSKSNNEPNIISDFLGSLFSNKSDDSSTGLILALILILSREGADNKLILALLYILL